MGYRILRTAYSYVSTEQKNKYEYYVFEKQYEATFSWLFWLGFGIYSLAFTVTTSALVNYITWQAIQSVGIILFLIGGINLISLRFESQYLKLLYTIYTVWLIFIFRGFEFNADFIKALFYNAYDGMFFLFTPYIALFNKTFRFYRYTFNVALILGMCFLILTFIFRKQFLNPDGSNELSRDMVDYFTKTLSIPCGFVLLTYLYQPGKKWLIALSVILFSLVIVVIRARRGETFMCLNILAGSVVIYYLINKGKGIKLLLFLVLLAIVAAIGVQIFNQNKRGLFDLMSDRIDEDTRSGVEICFYADMNTSDWILGKGINGKYFCPGIDNPNSIYRTGIETDYLNLILRGGIVYLIILVLLTLPAIFKGLFRSNNILSKASAIWILLWMIDLYPTPVTKFTLNYILVWICVSICYSYNIRNISDDEIMNYLSNIE